MPLLPKIITFKDQSIFQFNALDIFNIIIDIEKYPSFIPWCHSIEIVSRGDTEIISNCVMKFKSKIAEYKSEISFKPPDICNDGYIKVRSNEGAFTYLQNDWKFIQLGINTTQVIFDIECQFRSKIMHYTMVLLYKKAQEKVISAFKHRIYSLLT